MKLSVLIIVALGFYSATCMANDAAPTDTAAPTTAAPTTAPATTPAPTTPKPTETPTKPPTPGPTSNSTAPSAPTVSLSESGVTAFLFVTSVAGFAFGLLWWVVLDKSVKVTNNVDEYTAINQSNRHLTPEILQRTYEISTAISNGAKTFLFAEYRYMAVFIVVFGALMFVLLGSTTSDYWTKAGFSFLSFVIGSVTSILSGWIGMNIAVFTNSRTALQATVGAAEGNLALQFRSSFQTAFRGGLTMGFCLTTLGLFALFINILICKAKFDDPQAVYECVAAFGLGGSAI
eukprot:PhF_6_TR39628/c3_g1_i3/m.58714/K01507/ppa; inorganic pyrophosphatase